MTPTPEPIRPRSVLAWGLVNLALLGLGSSGYPLWAHHPAPRESLCFFELLCGQVIAWTLLYPVLSPTLWTTGLNLLLLLPFTELAGFLSNLGQLQILRGEGSAALWIVGLSGVGWSLRRQRQPIVIAIASTFVLGGAMLDYLRWEAVANNGATGAFLPLSFLPKLVQNTQYGEPWGWVEAAIPLLTALILQILSLGTPQFTTIRKCV